MAVNTKHTNSDSWNALTRRAGFSICCISTNEKQRQQRKKTKRKIKRIKQPCIGLYLHHDVLLLPALVSRMLQQRCTSPTEGEWKEKQKKRSKETEERRQKMQNQNKKNKERKKERKKSQEERKKSKKERKKENKHIFAQSHRVCPISKVCALNEIITLTSHQEVPDAGRI